MKECHTSNDYSMQSFLPHKCAESSGKQRSSPQTWRAPTKGRTQEKQTKTKTPTTLKIIIIVTLIIIIIINALSPRLMTQPFPKAGNRLVGIMSAVNCSDTMVASEVFVQIRSWILTEWGWGLLELPGVDYPIACNFY